jgi:hypothetical protein
LLNKLEPVDRLPGLRVGKQWTSRIVNPFSALSPGNWLMGGQPTFEIIQHQVTGTETISWNDQSFACFVVEHFHERASSKSWVRIQDGRVLRQQAPFGDVTITLELDPIGTGIE